MCQAASAPQEGMHPSAGSSSVAQEAGWLLPGDPPPLGRVILPTPGSRPQRLLSRRPRWDSSQPPAPEPGSRGAGSPCVGASAQSPMELPASNSSCENGAWSRRGPAGTRCTLRFAFPSFALLLSSASSPARGPQTGLRVRTCHPT